MRTPVLLVAALLMSGCISALATDTARDPATAQAPSGPGAGTPATHGTPQRTDGPVTVTVGPNGFVAAKDVAVANDFGGSPAARLKLSTQNGAVRAAAGPGGGYQLAAHLEGSGKTEQEARAALDTLTVVNLDSLDTGLLDLALEVRFADLPAPVPTPVPIPSTSVGTLQRSARLSAALPAAPSEELRLETTNGAIGVEGLHGSRLAARTSNGAIHAAGAWDAADLRTTNGAIHLDGLFNDLDADTTNGAIGGTIASQRTCKQTLQTTNGSVKLGVKDGGHGYKVEGSTTNGRVAIAIGGAQASGKDTQRAQTPGFDGAAVQVTLKAESTNGSIDLRSA